MGWPASRPREPITSAFASYGHAGASAYIRVDGSGLARTFFTHAGWSVQPCVRPFRAVHMTAGHNALRGSGPGQNLAFEMHWHWWVVLIAGSTGSALRAVRPPNLHITPVSARSLPRRGKCDGLLVAFTFGHHGPRHPCNLVGGP